MKTHEGLKAVRKTQPELTAHPALNRKEEIHR